MSLLQADPPLRYRRFQSLKKQRGGNIHYTQSRKQSFDLPYIQTNNHSPNTRIRENRTKTISSYPSNDEKIRNDSVRLSKGYSLVQNMLAKSRRSKYYPRKLSANDEIEMDQLRLQTIKDRFKGDNDEEDQAMQGFRLKKNSDLFDRKGHKIYRIIKKKGQESPPKSFKLLDETPVIDRLKVGRIFKNRNRQVLYEIVKTPLRPTYLKMEKIRRDRLWRTFRKAGNAALFIVYLRKYTTRIRNGRLHFFQAFIKEKLHQKLLQLKTILAEHSRPLFQTVVDQYEFDYNLYEKDDIKLKKEKVRAIKQLVGLQLQSLQNGISKIANQQNLSQILYYICKHGSFAHFHSLLTEEELNQTSISLIYGYISADSFIEQSRILSLVFIKLLLFNILLQPHKIAILENYSGTKFVFRNIKLIGNILYELIIEKQNILIQQAIPVYLLGNWQQCKNKFPIKIAQSMKLREDSCHSKQLISGLADPRFIRQVYGIANMTNQKRILSSLIHKLHNKIVEFHSNARMKYF